MADHEPILGADDFAAMSFGDKLSLTKALTLSYGLKIAGLLLLGGLAVFLLVMLGGLVLGLFVGAIGSFLGAGAGPAGQALAVLGLMLLAGLLIQMLGLGVNTLILGYLSGQEPDSLIAVVLSPWARFRPIFYCLLVWLGAAIAWNLALSLVGLIPVLGLLVNFAGTILYYLVNTCAMFCMADRLVYQGGELRPARAVTWPIQLIFDGPLAWLLFLAAAVIAYLPLGAGVVIWFFRKIPLAEIDKNPDALMDAISSFPGWGILLILVYLMVAHVALLFLAGLTYRQAEARQGAGMSRFFD